MDSVCGIHKSFVGIFTDFFQTYNEMPVSKLYEKSQNTIGKHKQFLQRILSLPPVKVTAPLSDYMRENNILTAEFQLMTYDLYAVASDFLWQTKLISETLTNFRDEGCARETLRIQCGHTETDLANDIAYLNTMPNFLFANFGDSHLSCIKEKAASLKALRIDFSTWTRTKFTAESLTSAVLDNIEDGTLALGRDVAKGKREVMELKMQIEELMAGDG